MDGGFSGAEEAQPLRVPYVPRHREQSSLPWRTSAWDHPKKIYEKTHGIFMAILDQHMCPQIAYLIVPKISKCL